MTQLNGDKPNDHSSSLRRLELLTVAHLITASDRVLEVGGGNGYHAALLSGLAEHVESIDIKPHAEPITPVTIYDGKSIPFPDAQFDVVYSSSVLEHIEDIDRTLAETRRVLKDDGFAIHTVPTVTWRIVTTLTHYPALPRIIWSNYRNLIAKNSQPADAAAVRPNANIGAPVGRSPIAHFKPKWIKSILRSPRHGERGNAFTEAWYYRRQWWRQRFEATGWKIQEEIPTHLFYTGNIAFGTMLPTSWRRVLSHCLGSSTRSFVLKKR